MSFSSRNLTRTKLEEMGVDLQILKFIDQLSIEEQQGIYHFFLEIMNDELIFVLALKDQKFTDDYLKQQEKKQPMLIN